MKLYGTVIVTYRCMARCNMCDCWKDPSKPEEEITIDTIKKLPKMVYVNITGGEPFLRNDLEDIIKVLYTKTNRIVVSTNGFLTKRILEVCSKFPKLGIRISIEGLEETNNAIRGLPDGWKKGYETLKTLVENGHSDVGFGMTVQDMNCHDLIKLYRLSEEMGMEFATATLHNSFYFRKNDNKIDDKYEVAKCFEELINALLKSKSPKKWFRAYFNHGLINYIYGNKRLLPCEMGKNAFFIDPYSEVVPCNGTSCKICMGNLKNQSWDELWNSSQRKEAQKQARNCGKQCWMIGSASPAIRKHIFKTGWWVFVHKFIKRGYSLKENKFIDIPQV